MSNLFLQVIEWSALGFGTLGTFMWATNKNQLAVSLLWMASAILWIVFAYNNGHYGLTARDVIGLLMYGMGIRTYWKSRQKELDGNDCKN